MLVLSTWPPWLCNAGYHPHCHRCSVHCSETSSFYMWNEFVIETRIGNEFVFDVKRVRNRNFGSETSSFSMWIEFVYRSETSLYSIMICIRPAVYRILQSRFDKKVYGVLTPKSIKPTMRCSNFQVPWFYSEFGHQCACSFWGSKMSGRML